MGEITGNGTAVSGLGGAAGYGETMLPRGDDTVAQVNVAAVFESGFNIGGVQYGANQLYISTDGLISFGAGVSGVAGNANAIAAPFFAIFNGDVDTRLDGETPESGAVWLDVDTVQDCVTITWDHVGFYRRNATATDTFQMQIFDRGNGGFDIVYRYQDINWTSGDLQGGWGGLGGIAAMIGYRAAASGAATLLGASGNEAAELGLPDTLGNTGDAGLWVYHFTNGSVINGTDAANTLQGTAANDTINGLGGADVLMGSAGADLLDGGLGLDRADYGSATTAIRIDLVTPAANLGQAAGDSYLAIEAFAGSTLADTLLGGALADSFYGGAGADSLDGRAGADSLYGGAGDDRVLGNDGNDALDGGADNDALYGNRGADTLTGGLGNDSLIGANGDDLMTGGDGADRLAGGSGADTLMGGSSSADLADTLAGGFGSDLIRGSAGDDLLRGNSGYDTLYGDDGNDLLTGRYGIDQLYGGVGTDMLRSGASNDLLDGGIANDTLIGGLGADTFRHLGIGGQGSDWVMDFDNAAGDRLSFGIDGAVKSDFSVTFINTPGAGKAAIAEAYITYLPLDRLCWILVDGADEAAIILQSSINSFDLL